MTDESNVVVATEARNELKSTDTSLKTLEPKVETPKPEAPKAEPTVEAKAEPVVPPEGVKTDAPDADSPQTESKQQRMPRWMKERLERERQVTEARTRAAVLEELQQRQTSPTAQTTEQPADKTIEDFDFDQDKYLDYKVQKALEAKEAQARAQAEQKKQAEAAESFKSRIDAFEARVGDGSWEDIATSPVNTDPRYKALTELFLGDDHDLDIAHHLATHPKEAEAMLAMAPLQRLREVAKLAERFDGSQKEADTPPDAPLPKKTTTAPPPPKTVSGAGKPSIDINDPGLTPEQRIAEWRRAAKRR